MHSTDLRMAFAPHRKTLPVPVITPSSDLAITENGIQSKPASVDTNLALAPHRKMQQPTSTEKVQVCVVSQVIPNFKLSMAPHRKMQQRTVAEMTKTDVVQTGKPASVSVSPSLAPHGEMQQHTTTESMIDTGAPFSESGVMFRFKSDMFSGKNLVESIAALPAEIGINAIIPWLDMESRQNFGATCHEARRMTHMVSASFNPIYHHGNALTSWHWASPATLPGAVKEGEVLGNDVNPAIATIDGTRHRYTPMATLTAFMAVSALRNLAQLEVVSIVTINTSAFVNLVHDLPHLRRVLISDCLFIQPAALIKEWANEFRHIHLDLSLPNFPALGTFQNIRHTVHFHWLAFLIWVIPILVNDVSYMVTTPSTFLASVIRKLDTPDVASLVHDLISTCRTYGPQNVVPELFDDQETLYMDPDAFVHSYNKHLAVHLPQILRRPYMAAALRLFTAVNSKHPHLNLKIMREKRDPAGVRLFHCTRHGVMFGGLMTAAQRKADAEEGVECFIEILEQEVSTGAESDCWAPLGETEDLLARVMAANEIVDIDGNYSYKNGKRYGGTVTPGSTTGIANTPN